MSQDLLSTKERLEEYRIAFERLEEITAQLDKQIEIDINFLHRTDKIACMAFEALDLAETDAENDSSQKRIDETPVSARSLDPRNRKLYYI